MSIIACIVICVFLVFWRTKPIGVVDGQHFNWKVEDVSPLFHTRKHTACLMWDYEHLLNKMFAISAKF